MRVLLLNRVENIVANGDIFCHNFFKSFQKLYAADASKCIYKWERVKSHLLQICCMCERVKYLWIGTEIPVWPSHTHI